MGAKVLGYEKSPYYQQRDLPAILLVGKDRDKNTMLNQTCNDFAKNCPAMAPAKKKSKMETDEEALLGQLLDMDYDVSKRMIIENPKYQSVVAQSILERYPRTVSEMLSFCIKNLIVTMF